MPTIKKLCSFGISLSPPARWRLWLQILSIIFSVLQFVLHLCDRVGIVSTKAKGMLTQQNHPDSVISYKTVSKGHSFPVRSGFKQNVDTGYNWSSTLIHWTVPVGTISRIKRVCKLQTRTSQIGVKGYLHYETIYWDGRPQVLIRVVLLIELWL